MQGASCSCLDARQNVRGVQLGDVEARLRSNRVVCMDGPDELDQDLCVDPLLRSWHVLQSGCGAGGMTC